MAKRKPPSPQAAPLLDELRGVESRCREPLAPGEATLCLLRVVTGLDTHDWSSLKDEHNLEHWRAVALPSPRPKVEALAQAVASLARGDLVDGNLADGATDGLLAFLRVEIDRSRACQTPLALALIEPDAAPAGTGLAEALLPLAQSLARSFDFAALHEARRLAVVFSGATLAEAERMAGAMLRRIRASPLEQVPDAPAGVLCSAGLAGYGGCVEFTPGDLVKRARAALDCARRQGGNRLEVAPSADVGMAPRDTLVHAREKHFLFTGKKAGDT